MLSDEVIEAAYAAATGADNADRAWELCAPLLATLDSDPEAAWSMLRVVRARVLDADRAAEVAGDILARYGDDNRFLSAIGSALEGCRDIDDLNAPAPEAPIFAGLPGRLLRAAAAAKGATEEADLLSALATAARLAGRRWDSAAEDAHRRLLELQPNDRYEHYNYGLFLKTRGRFAEGLEANRRALELSAEPSEAAQWNFGICATGAGAAEDALDMWLQIGQKIRMGRFGLPDGSYPQCKVRLAERPLAERPAAQDDPGQEETIWVERLSPCHGIIRSVLYEDLGVDYGDVVLFDGAPITYHRYGDEQIPVHPQLATLRRSGYRFFDFAGTQRQAGQVADSSRGLDRDAIVYSHTENVVTLCGSCWRDPDNDHERHEKEEHHVVTGRIAAPPDYEPAKLLADLDAAATECRIFAPGLCLAAGDPDRAAFERRKFEMLRAG